MTIEPLIQRLLRAVAGLCMLIVLGSCGYALIEGWSVADGFFMTVITVSTVGYGETNELTDGGRWFTSVLIFLCVVGMTYLTASLTSFIVEHDLSGQQKQKRMLKMISKLRNHTIVCGCGPMAEAIIERLMGNRVSVVVIADDKDRMDALRRRFRNLLVVEGNATNELLLAEAGLMRAGNVIAALESELDNLLVCITCKDVGRKIAVFARSNDATIANRMRKAGVDAVISPNQLCGDRIAGLICEPATDELVPQDPPPRLPELV